MSVLPPAPTFEPFTILDKQTIDRMGKAPIMVTSLMWMEWFQRLSGYVTPGNVDHDAMLLSYMEKGQQGDVGDLGSKVRDVEATVSMITVPPATSVSGKNTDAFIFMQATDLNEVMKIRHDMELLIAMGGL